MDLSRFSEISNFLGYNGVCLSPEKFHLLPKSLEILQWENNFRKTFYWGRIYGVRNDYHVAYGCMKDCLRSQKYFYSFDGVEWLLMPKPPHNAEVLAPLAVTAFEGDPAIVTTVEGDNPGSMPQELKEEDRLACTIKLINEDAMIVPRGAWYKRSDGEIVPNKSFVGLSAVDAVRKRSYLHARAPQQKWDQNLSTRPDYNYAIDFLDSIVVDVPPGCWSLQIHENARLATVQSLYWPGMMFYHIVDSSHYGSLYVGHGMKNLDVPFMI